MIALLRLNTYTVHMYSKIIQWRLLGIRRDKFEIANDPGVYSVVTMSYADGHRCLHAQKHDVTNQEGKVLLPLWDAVCVGKGPYDELWRGYQRAKLPHGLGYATVIQEWYIEHLAMRAPQDK